MKLIIAGPRDFEEDLALNLLHGLMVWFPWEQVTEVFSGKAEGVDTAGERWAEDVRVPVRGFPADWKRYGKSAGPIRNTAMAEEADGLLLLWRGDSRGSADIKLKMEQRGKPIWEAMLRAPANALAAESGTEAVVMTLPFAPETLDKEGRTS